jgi:GH25 family lysozyme M1 (1,4-beta-N-acetylmuramidase)
MHPILRPIARRVLPIGLTAALLIQPALAAGQPTVPNGWTSPFSDVTEQNWYYPFVAVLNQDGVINGYDDGRFGALDTTRAGDAILMILKAAGVGTLEPLSGGHYASGYAQYAIDQGWVEEQEMPDLTGSVSRLFIAQLAAKALGLSAATGLSPFADVSDGYLTTLYQKGVVAGSQVGDQLVFQPDAPITRAEISAIIWQVREYATHIHFGNYTLDILEGVPVNPYSAADFGMENGRVTYLGTDREALLGIDVSSHQKEIDWNAVAADGIQFAMIRVGGRYYGTNSGTVFEDSWAKKNLQGALDAGLEVGVYFFSQAITVEEAQEEARFLLDLIDGYDLTGPVVYDWETIGTAPARTDNLDTATLNNQAIAFCQMVEDAGYSPMIYFNQRNAYLNYDLRQITKYPFWLAQYTSVPTFYYGFEMWQFTDSGSVQGISGRVDMNLWLRPVQDASQDIPQDIPQDVQTGRA